MSGPAIIFWYAVFAILATIANLGTQSLVMAVDDGMLAYGMALVAGTGMGLVVKYLLDKRWIFADRSRGMAAHGRKFSLYTLMGVVSTLIFWGVETLFWFTWHTHEARITGAVLGLSIGYVIKYQLDRRYVFTGSRPGTGARPASAHRP